MYTDRLILTEEEQLTLLDLEIESQEPLYTPETYPWWTDQEHWELGPDPEDDNPLLPLGPGMATPEATSEESLRQWFREHERS